MTIIGDQEERDKNIDMGGGDRELRGTYRSKSAQSNLQTDPPQTFFQIPPLDPRIPQLALPLLHLHSSVRIHCTCVEGRGRKGLGRLLKLV
jgi:hypothetical protein